MAYDFDDPNIWLDPDLFAERIIYTPLNGRSRTIYAVIEREHFKAFGPAGGAGGAGRDNAPMIEVWISSDPIKGAAKIDTGGDTLTFARRQGFAAAAQMIAEVLGDSTPNMWHLRMR